LQLQQQQQQQHATFAAAHGQHFFSLGCLFSYGIKRLGAQVLAKRCLLGPASPPQPRIPAPPHLLRCNGGAACILFAIIFVAQRNYPAGDAQKK